jgi:hypothetical protein
MLYNHLWTPPTIAMQRRDGEHIAIAMQECVRCGTTKNPLNDRLIRIRRAPECRLAEASRQDFAAAIRRIRSDLDAMESNGQTVDREAGRRRKDPAQPILPYVD